MSVGTVFQEKNMQDPTLHVTKPVRGLRQSAVVSLLLIMCLFGSTALAQNNLATITGAITDPTSASIPAASVEATNVATGVVYRGSTTDAGIYNPPRASRSIYDTRGALFRAMKKHEYDGWVVAESDHSPHSEESVMLNGWYVKQVLAKL